MMKLLVAAVLIFLSTVTFGQRFSQEVRMNNNVQTNHVLTFDQVTPEMWYYDVLSVTVYYTDGTEIYIPRETGDAYLDIFYKAVSDAIDNDKLNGRYVSQIYLEGVGTFLLTNATHSFNQYTVFYNNIYYPYYNNRVIYIQRIHANRTIHFQRRSNTTRIGIGTNGRWVSKSRLGTTRSRITNKPQRRYNKPQRTRGNSSREYSNRNVRSKQPIRANNRNVTPQRTSQRSVQRTPQRTQSNVQRNNGNRTNSSSIRNTQRGSKR